MNRIMSITSMVRVIVNELQKEVIIINRNNEPSEFITIDKNKVKSQTLNEKLAGFEELETVFKIPCTRIVL